MNPKTAVYVGALVGSGIGGYIPLLWGGDLFSFSSVILTAFGGIIGIYVAFRLSN